MIQKNILVVLPVEERHKKMLEEAYPGGNFRYGRPACAEDLKDVNVIIGNIPPKLLSAAPKLEWVQLDSAGADQYVKSRILKEGTLLTNSTGAFGLAISEYLIGGTLCLMKRFNRYQINQARQEWKDEGHVHSIDGSRTLIVGLGDIGGEYGRKMKALGSYVVGIKRHLKSKPEWLDELYGMDSLEAELPKADIVAMALPSTPLTAHIMDLHKIGLMKKSAILLNVGRGNAIVTDDLCKALKDQMIFGACLDVTDPEPLPPGHPLWDAGNILITPHTSGQYHLPETFERIIQIACSNLRRFRNGLTLQNLVDFSTGYRKNQ